MILPNIEFNVFLTKFIKKFALYCSMEQGQKEVKEVIEVIEKLRTELKIRGLSSLTQRNYCFFVSKLFEFCKKKPSELNEEDVKAYLASLFDRKARSTISLAASSLKFFYSEILGKPFLKVKLPKKERTLPKVLTKEEIDKIILGAETEKSEIIVRTLYYTGLRVSELVNLKRKDINFETGQGIIKGKGNKQRQIFLPPKLIEKLEGFFGKHPDYEYVLSKDKPLTARNIQKIVEKIAKKQKIQKKVTPHTFRHSYATHLLEDGTDIRTIQVLLGHENLQTTQIYTKVTDTLYKKAKINIDNLERV